MFPLNDVASVYMDKVTCSVISSFVKSKMPSKRSRLRMVLLPLQASPTTIVETYFVTRHSSTRE